MFENIVGSATTTIDQIFFWFMILLCVGLFGVALWFIMFKLQFKHTFIIRELANKRKILSVDKFRVFKDKRTGVEWFQLWGMKDRVPVAPNRCIEITKKGKMLVEAYRTPTGEYIYIKDETSDVDNLDENDNFKPITTSQRVIQFHLFEGKMKHKRKTWKDLIIPIVGIFALTIIVISLMVFWGDIAKPVLEMGDKMAAITEKQGEITDSLKELIQKEQVIKDTGTPPQAPN